MLRIPAALRWWMQMLTLTRVPTYCFCLRVCFCFCLCWHPCPCLWSSGSFWGCSFDTCVHVFWSWSEPLGASGVLIFYVFSRVLGASESVWGLQDAQGCSEALYDASGCSWMFQDALGCFGMLWGVSGCSGTFPDVLVCFRTFNNRVIIVYTSFIKHLKLVCI